MRLTGRITTWKDDQGYGFITPNNGGPQVFVHVKAFLDAKVRPIVNDRVAFELTTDERGRLQAKYVRREGAAFKPRAVDNSDTPLLSLAVLFLAFVGGAALVTGLPPVVPGLYLGASLATFLLYRADKLAAREGRWRTPEKTLLLLGLLGGWPGALVAQRLLRHKSSKTSFQLAFWITVFVNIGTLCWLLTPRGSALLHEFIESGARL